MGTKEKMSKQMLFSINIPTFNSEKTLERTLKSIMNQTYKNFEIIVMDHYSTDKTVEIAKKYTKKIFLDKGRLLSSRRIGFNESKGEFVFFVDSDQVWEPDLLERVAKLLKEKDFDMLILEERSYKPTNLIEKMTDIDRRLVQEEFEIDPSKSVLLARAFRRSLLKKVFDRIDKKLDEFVVVQDHAIIYFEAWNLSKKIGSIRKAVYHTEPNTWKEVFHHYYTWGKRSKGENYKLPKKYDEMFSNKLKSRLLSIKPWRAEHWAVMPLIFVKGLAFKWGSYFG